ncbi:Hypothetical protein SCLAV_p1473 (plasmid) [Streptomyces clavuligerus]|uniref:Uncharacterized protein n=1 Tax=Streptomyces clavuligerus TaxID=1901 RepID=D5SM12_STRCL|nr:Hypothetical protein SCLAV_p1473 [Streptomyces clavuligerus]
MGVTQKYLAISDSQRRADRHIAVTWFSTSHRAGNKFPRVR